MFSWWRLRHKFRFKVFLLHINFPVCCPIVLTKIAFQILELPLLWNPHRFMRHVPRFCCQYASRRTFSKVVHDLIMITSFRFLINATCTLCAQSSVSLEKQRHDVNCPQKDSWVARVRFRCTSTATTFIANTTVFAVRISIDSTRQSVFVKHHTQLSAFSQTR